VEAGREASTTDTPKATPEVEEVPSTREATPSTTMTIRCEEASAMTPRKMSIGVTSET